MSIPDVVIGDRRCTSLDGTHALALTVGGAVTLFMSFGMEPEGAADAAVGWWSGTAPLITIVPDDESHALSLFFGADPCERRSIKDGAYVAWTAFAFPSHYTPDRAFMGQAAFDAIAQYDTEGRTWTAGPPPTRQRRRKRKRSITVRRLKVVRS